MTTRPCRPDRPLEPAGGGPGEHQLRRRQHLREGHRDRPCRRRGRRAAVGEGLRRRPGHADGGRPGGAAAGPAARSRRRLPGRRPRGRDGRRVRLLPARQGRCGAVDRHGDARPRRRRARRPPAPRLRDRAGHRRGRRDAHPASASATGWCGCRGAGPGFQLGLDIAAIKAENPQAIGVILGGHGITAWGDTSEECEANSLEIIRTAQEFLDERGVAEPFGAVVPGNAAAARGRAAGQGGRDLPDDPRPRLHGRPAGRSLHRQRRRARLPRPREARAAGRARHVVPGPLPADQGQAARRRPARHRAPPRRSSAG